MQHQHFLHVGGMASNQRAFLIDESVGDESDVEQKNAGGPADCLFVSRQPVHRPHCNATARLRSLEARPPCSSHLHARLQPGVVSSHTCASANKRCFFCALSSGLYFSSNLNSVSAVLLSSVRVNLFSAGGTFKR
jgi:hypothetical protein